MKKALAIMAIAGFANAAMAQDISAPITLEVEIEEYFAFNWVTSAFNWTAAGNDGSTLFDGTLGGIQTNVPTWISFTGGVLTHIDDVTQTLTPSFIYTDPAGTQYPTWVAGADPTYVLTTGPLNSQCALQIYIYPVPFANLAGEYNGELAVTVSSTAP